MKCGICEQEIKNEAFMLTEKTDDKFVHEKCYISKFGKSEKIFDAIECPTCGCICPGCGCSRGCCMTCGCCNSKSQPINK